MESVTTSATGRVNSKKPSNCPLFPGVCSLGKLILSLKIEPRSVTVIWVTAQLGLLSAKNAALANNNLFM